MAFLSRGCQTCRLRRIKCDGAEPVCQRCRKSRRICIDTTAIKQAYFSIQVENHYASGTHKRPRGPRSSLTALLPRFDMHSRALMYFMQNHLQTLPDIPNASGALALCMSSWKANLALCSTIELGLSCVALAVYARIFRHAEAATEALTKYTGLVRLVQDHIKRLQVCTWEEREIDAYLFAILLMGRYERVTHETEESPGHEIPRRSSLYDWSHHDGAHTILKLWHDNPKRGFATFTITQMRRGLIKTSLLRGLPLPDWALRGETFGEHDLDLMYDTIFVQIVNLHHKVIQSCREQTLPLLELIEMKEQAQKLDEDLQDWIRQTYHICSVQRHVLQEVDTGSKGHFNSSVVYTFAGCGSAVIWTHYLASRMLVNSMQLKILASPELLQVPAPIYKQERVECDSRLATLADSMAASIPYCLGKVKLGVDGSSMSPNEDVEIKPYQAGVAVWPLTIAMNIPELDAVQRQWFGIQLADIGRIQGDGALQSANSASWPYFNGD